MANIAAPCQFMSHQNIGHCGPILGICVTQPAYQMIPDGSIVNNPAYLANLGKSFWTYRFIIDCNKCTRTIRKFGIPICSHIKPDQIIVYERINGYGFDSVFFTLKPCDPKSGYQWLIVTPKGRYDKGTCVEYCMEIVGDYPAIVQAIMLVKTNIFVLPFKCNSLKVPGCPKSGKLEIIKTCKINIKNNQASLNCMVKVYNIGNTPLNNVQYLDNIVIPMVFSLGQISVSPSCLHINTSTPGIVKIDGKLGQIKPGNCVIIEYTIPIVSISKPGTFIITNTATASAYCTQASSTCSSVLEIVKLKSYNSCSVNNSTVTFYITLSSTTGSPDTRVDIVDQLFIPAGLTVVFNDFSGHMAYTPGNDQPVPLNTEIHGPVTVLFNIKGIRILEDGSAHKKISLTVLSCTNFGMLTIRNTLRKVTLSDPCNQLYLGTTPLPLEADIRVNLSTQCH